MKDNEELDKLLDEIPYATSALNLHNIFLQQQHHDRVQHQHHHHQLNGYAHVHGCHNGHVNGSSNLKQTVNDISKMYEYDPSVYQPKYTCISPVSGFSLQSEGSSSSSTHLFDDGSPTSPPFDDIKPQTSLENTHQSNGIWAGKNSFGNLTDDISANLRSMSIGEETKVGTPVGPDGFYEDGRRGFSGYGGINSLSPAGLMDLDDERRSALLGLQREYQISNLSRSSCVTPSRFNPVFAHQGYYANPITSPHLINDGTLYKTYNYMGTQVPNAMPSMTRPSDNPLFSLQRTGLDSNGNIVLLDSLYPQLNTPYLPIGVEELRYRNPSMSMTPNSWTHRPPSLMRNAHDIGAFYSEDSLIIQGEALNYLRNKRHHHPRASTPINNGDNPSALPLKYNSLSEVRGYIYFIAKDQNGCRFLQRKFDEGGSQELQIIFNEIIDHVVELMMNPFGNYLMQKLFDVCNEEQRMQIILMVTSQPGKLVMISLNTHGSALEPGFLDLINDINGNHVIQRCLQCLSNEDNKFIFHAAAKSCVDIATHRHGCCVLQRCIAHSTGEHRAKLISRISANGLHLAQNSYGNYVVQYILDLKIPSATVKLVSQFDGSYVHLSMQKFSSNVVEKCLKVFNEEYRSRIIRELLSASRFEQLLQDPYANYVVQCAIEVSKV
ncbi:hypothetical protein GIB67_013992 [Kingdonia uniflora]|uniref:PUM-HD domain-containing protein n=1 Tax=Kingdonia uniflora TaxID=39325 RepID=A0A7J7LDS6_9MAGN|nr:hypothetical protein GIB67_013992 [Kingdonia uniflora]